MKLKSFRVFNYRSIIDSKECYLSPEDGITILAGQNESGKSSMLEALYHYEKATPCSSAYRDEDRNSKPKVICTYSIEEDEELFSSFYRHADSDIEDDAIRNFINENLIKEHLNSISTIKLSRIISYEEDESYDIVCELDSVLKAILENLHSKEEYKSIDINIILELISSNIFTVSPLIVLFDEFFDTLPDKFYIDDINNNFKTKGLQAVKNVETILDTKFIDLKSLSDYKSTKQQREYEEKLTANFNERWQQRIGDEKGAVISVTYHQGGKEDKPYLRFSIQTRSGEFLPPEKRSLGFRWFLSFYLHLTAEDKRNHNMVLLFDEPGLHLHSKAQYDMLKIFEELSQSNQIIYATHSPYLINPNKLHRVRLVFNSKKSGTTIEKITTNLSINQKDAIKPIIDAIGLEVAHTFSAAKDKNIIVEGISDYYYLTAAKRLLNIEDDFYFMPAMGASNAHLLLELCIGWGLKWLMIFDEKGSEKDVNKIKKNFFSSDDEVSKKIHILKGCDGIEDIFTEEDIKLAHDSFSRTTQSLSKDLAKSGGKEIIGRFFLDKVQSGEITLDKLSDKAKGHFNNVFAFINNEFK